MYYAIYYNRKGEVKKIPFNLDRDNNTITITADEDFFIKGIVFPFTYDSWDAENSFYSILTPMERHFIETAYGFHQEIRFDEYRLAHSKIVIDFAMENGWSYLFDESEIS